MLFQLFDGKFLADLVLDLFAFEAKLEFYHIFLEDLYVAAFADQVDHV